MSSTAIRDFITQQIMGYTGMRKVQEAHSGWRFLSDDVDADMDMAALIGGCEASGNTPGSSKELAFARVAPLS